MRTSYTTLIALATIHSVEGHGAVVFPPPRNAVDKDLAPWSGKVPAHPPSVESKTGWCPVPARDGTISGQNGQACCERRGLRTIDRSFVPSR